MTVRTPPPASFRASCPRPSSRDTSRLVPESRPRRMTRGPGRDRVPAQGGRDHDPEAPRAARRRVRGRGELSAAARVGAAVAGDDPRSPLRERALRGDAESRPVDDRLPGPPPRLDTQTRKEFERHGSSSTEGGSTVRFRRWANSRRARRCSFLKGRARVAQLVRTFPLMFIPGGSIHPPREMLLKELGLLG